jgi:transposase
VRISPYLGEHIRHNVFGAVRLKDGRLCSMLFNLCDSDTFQAFLDSLAQENPLIEGRRALLVLDNASWHNVKRLNWHHFEPVYLPPRSPDLNPIERLWLRLKASMAGSPKAPPNSKTALSPLFSRSLASLPSSSRSAAQRSVYDGLFENWST